jgi:hypothetical protein
VDATPPDSTIKIVNIGPKYYPGIALEPGSYDIHVSHEDYEPVQQSILLSAKDVRVAITLKKRDSTPLPPSLSSTFRLTVKATPSDSIITILGLQQQYYPGIALKPGSYDIRVTRDGYVPVVASIKVRRTDDVEYPVTLTKDREQPSLSSSPPPLPTPQDQPYKQQEAERARLLKEQQDLQRRIDAYNQKIERHNKNADRLNDPRNRTPNDVILHNLEVAKHEQEGRLLEQEL